MYNISMYQFFLDYLPNEIEAQHTCQTYPL